MLSLGNISEFLRLGINSEWLSLGINSEILRWGINSEWLRWVLRFGIGLKQKSQKQLSIAGFEHATFCTRSHPSAIAVHNTQQNQYLLEGHSAHCCS